MPSSLNGTGLTFNSGQTLNALPVTSFIGQTGAVDPTVYGGIGCFLPVFLFSLSNLNANTTIAGTSLIVGNSIASTYNGNLYYGFAAVTNNTQRLSVAQSIFNGIAYYFRQNAGNRGFELPTGMTQLSGTWRILSPVLAGDSYYDAAYNQYTASYRSTLAVRIA